MELALRNGAIMEGAENPGKLEAQVAETSPYVAWSPGWTPTLGIVVVGADARGIASVMARSMRRKNKAPGREVLEMGKPPVLPCSRIYSYRDVSY